MSEKIKKLSKYLYCETKKKGLGTEIQDIKYSQFYCRNNTEYFQLLETLKSTNVIDFKKFDGPNGSKGTHSTMYGDPKLLGPAMLILEKDIDGIEARHTITLNFQDSFSQIADDMEKNSMMFLFAMHQKIKMILLDHLLKC